MPPACRLSRRPPGILASPPFPMNLRRPSDSPSRCTRPSAQRASGASAPHLKLYPCARDPGGAGDSSAEPHEEGRWRGGRRNAGRGQRRGIPIGADRDADRHPADGAVSRHAALAVDRRGARRHRGHDLHAARHLGSAAAVIGGLFGNLGGRRDVGRRYRDAVTSTDWRDRQLFARRAARAQSIENWRRRRLVHPSASLPQSLRARR